MANSGIYKILNTITGDFYIGSSINLTRRKAEYARAFKENSRVLSGKAKQTQNKIFKYEL